MSDFDTRLHTRLERLDAAVPPAGPPSVSTARARSPRRRRQVVVLLAATVALLVGTSVVTMSAPPPPDPALVEADRAAEERISDDIGALTADRCMSLAELRVLVRDRLDALGYPDWQIETRDGAERSRCVTSGAVGDMHVVLLLPGIGGDVAKAMDRVAAELMTRCLDRGHAIALLKSTLEGLGIADPRIRTDGPILAPIGQEDAVRQHIANGCYVYGGTQDDGAGVRTFYVSGR